MLVSEGQGRARGPGPLQQRQEAVVAPLTLQRAPRPVCPVAMRDGPPRPCWGRGWALREEALCSLSVPKREDSSVVWPVPRTRGHAFESAHRILQMGAMPCRPRRLLPEGPGGHVDHGPSSLSRAFPGSLSTPHSPIYVPAVSALHFWLGVF